ncbi:helix-turn-helix domain-containing protein [Devosia rhodophyticola]|uniref:Helix-turn-helix domain-containing protein n=1 Tax=Devosia rhodophyticola TaxID=3026423 RepID=A0ABY7YWH1_9HYPH|nr:helix-turn-helix domain-containing protein [Devosia rhodophyticola]WDR05532.1 helix-turn-helix domain-containing protein [Devosia rhodophyticola]
MVYTAGGMGRFGHEGGEIIVQQDDWVLIPPGARHDYGVESSLAHWELVWVHFDPHPQWLNCLNWPVVHGGLMHLNIGGSVGRGVASRFMQVHQLHNSTLHRREAIAINALEDVLLQCDQHNPGAVRDHGDDRVSNAIGFMEQNLQKNIGVDDIAAAVGLSTSRLAHLFRAESGRTPQNYLESLRMRRAAEMLGRTNFRVKHIAATVGYENPLYFSLRFKAWAQKVPQNSDKLQLLLRSRLEENWPAGSTPNKTVNWSNNANAVRRTPRAPIWRYAWAKPPAAAISSA